MVLVSKGMLIDATNPTQSDRIPVERQLAEPPGVQNAKTDADGGYMAESSRTDVDPTGMAAPNELPEVTTQNFKSDVQKAQAQKDSGALTPLKTPEVYTSTKKQGLAKDALTDQTVQNQINFSLVGTGNTTPNVINFK
jgi:hypothetical protein